MRPTLFVLAALATLGCLGDVAIATPSHSNAQPSSQTYTTFLDWCTHIDTIDPAARRTVQLFMAEVDEIGKENCDAANLALSSRSTLDLMGTNVTDLRPIAGLTSLQRLNLLETNVTDLRAIDSLIQKGLRVIR